MTLAAVLCCAMTMTVFPAVPMHVMPVFAEK